MKMIALILLGLLVTGCTTKVIYTPQTNPYAALYYHNDTGKVLPIANHDVYYNITGLNIDGAYGVNATTDGFYVIEQGMYELNYGMSFSGQANSKYDIAVKVNDVVQDQGHAHRTIGTGGSVGNAGSAAIMNLQTGDYVQLAIEDEVNPAGDITIYTLTITLVGAE